MGKDAFGSYLRAKRLYHGHKTVRSVCGHGWKRSSSRPKLQLFKPVLLRLLCLLLPLPQPLSLPLQGPNQLLGLLSLPVLQFGETKEGHWTLETIYAQATKTTDAEILKTRQSQALKIF